MLISCILLCAALAAALWQLFLLKADIRQLQRRLAAINHLHTNTQLSTATYERNITALAEEINTMLERHRQDLCEKDHAEAALKSALTNISHDLRTPLTSALGYLQMLDPAAPLSPSSDDETKQKYLIRIQERLETVSGLINNLFEFARLIEGHTTVDLKRVNIGNILRETLSASYADLVQRNFTVDIDIPDTPLFSLCDEDALERVLLNLIKNVCTHGQDYMHLRLDGSVIEITNKTNSAHPFAADNLFDRFYTADTSRNTKNTGLGLAICKELIERMGGHISAHTTGNLLTIKIILRDCNGIK